VAEVRHSPHKQTRIAVPHHHWTHRRTRPHPTVLAHPRLMALVGIAIRWYVPLRIVWLKTNLYLHQRRSVYLNPARNPMKRIQTFQAIIQRTQQSRLCHAAKATASIALAIGITWHSALSAPVGGKSPALTHDMRSQKLVEAIAALCFAIPSYGAVKKLVTTSEQAQDLHAINRWSRAQWAEAAALPPSQTEIESFTYSPPQPLEQFQWADLCHRPNRYAHLLILGKTGSGKSFLAEHLIKFLIGHFGGEAWVLHPHIKPGEFEGHSIKGRGRNFPEIGEALGKLLAEMQSRYEKRDRGDESYGWLHVMIDEFPAIAKYVESAPGAVADLAREARKVKIRLVLLVQGEEVKTLGIEGQGSLRDQFTYIRLAGFVEDFAKTLKNPALTDWLDKQEYPCMVEKAPADTSQLIGVAPAPVVTELSDRHMAIFDFALKKSSSVSARDLQKSMRLFRQMSAEEIRAFFYELESQGFGTVDEAYQVPRYTPFTRRLQPPSASDSN
jgi:energy-coupling factor transporter ATP-binding protein EcfA2